MRKKSGVYTLNAEPGHCSGRLIGGCGHFSVGVDWILNKRIEISRNMEVLKKN
jgi:hypothetical protein